MQYCQYIKAFTKPAAIVSPSLDILLQEVRAMGYTFRNYLFNVKQPVSLITTISFPKLCIVNMRTASVDLTLDKLEKISLNQGEYSIFYQNTKEQLISLQPGISEMVRCDYDIDKIKKHAATYSFSEKWLHTIESGKSTLLYNTNMDAPLESFFEKIRLLKMSTEEEEQDFYYKVRGLLLFVAKQIDKRNLKYHI